MIRLVLPTDALKRPRSCQNSPVSAVLRDSGITSTYSGCSCMSISRKCKIVTVRVDRLHVLADTPYRSSIHLSETLDHFPTIFRARLLALLLKWGIITQELIDFLMSWNHNSGFLVHGEQKVNGSHGDSIETIARYMSRAAISVERVELNLEDNTVTVYEKQNRTSSTKKTHYEVFEFMALLAGHLPSPYETLAFCYGIYSSSYRGKERKEKKGDTTEMEKLKGKAKAGVSWARLIH